MALSVNPTLALRRVHVQKDPSGKVMGAAVYLHAEAILPYIFGEQEFLDIEIEPRGEGIMLLVQEDDQP